MGKDSKHQRTKGGVQPSSSSRTAELLQKTQSGGNAFSFMAAAAEAKMEFGGGIKSQTSVLTNLLIDDDLHPEVRMVLRKLQKKDAVTKIKALAELAQLLGAPPTPNNNSPASSREASVERPRINPDELEDLSKALLPHWIKAYQKLVLDDSRKVREQAQITLTQVCKNVGRNLAPYLKTLMPSLFLAQNDLYSPVASAAKKALQVVFPSETKRMEVLRFCKSEILKVIVDHLQSIFRGGKKPDLPTHKEKKQKGKKKDISEKVVATGGGDIDTSTVSAVAASSSDANKGDGETFALRVACASLQSLRSLIEQSLVDYEVLEEVFGSNGLIWGASDITKEQLVRRNMYDTLASLTNYLKTNPVPPSLEALPQSSATSTLEATQFQIPSDKCTKFINAALSSNQREILPNLWNTYLLLTLNGVLSDIQLARKQLLTCCKNGFYGNASQIGPSVLPLLSRIWDGLISQEGNSAQEFSHDIIAATIIGYGNERSLFEKASIARTLGEIVAFMCKRQTIEMRPVYQFIFSNLSDLTSDFARLFGTLVTNQTYYDGLIEFAVTENVDTVNSKDFGNFVVNLCTASYLTSNSSSSSSSASSPFKQAQQTPGGFRRKVKFQEDHSDESSTVPLLSFTSLSDQKQTFVQSVVKHCLQTQAYKPLIVISRKFKDKKIWSDVNILEIKISSQEDKLTRLQLYLELINVHPELPALLANFSDEFDHFQDPPDFKQFLQQVEMFCHLAPLKRWVRMTLFTTMLENLLTSSSLEETQLQTILKFVFHTDRFPIEFINSIISILIERIGRDSIFFDNLSHILVSNFKTIPMTDMSEIYKHYWETYFLKSVQSTSVTETNTDLELIETVCFRNLDKLDPSDIVLIMEKYLESCDKIKQIDILLDINKRLEFPAEMWQAMPQSQLRVKPDFLSVLGFSYKTDLATGDTNDPIPKFSKVHRSAIPKAIFTAKILLNSDNYLPTDLIVPLLNVIYAQGLGKIWEEVEKSSYFDKLNRELATELDVVSSRLTERIHEDSVAWKRLWEEVANMETVGDPLCLSRLPLRILASYCNKAEITTGIKKARLQTTPPSEETFKDQVTQILDDFSLNSYKVHEVIPWLTEKRVKVPEEFEFEPLFKHIKNKSFVNKLLVITTELMQRVVKDDELTEEFLSLGACWVSAWLKQSKYINVQSKEQLHWVSNLARAVKVISQKARNVNQLSPKFIQEYIEFHASQLYPVIYSWYVQLNEEVHSHNFWTLQTLLYVSEALVTCPSNTLAFIEPDGARLCQIFGTVLGTGASLPTKIAAYRILRKVRYDCSGVDSEGGSELPIVPPVMGQFIGIFVDQLVSDPENDDILISYLLIWDALLKIQQGSTEFATYVRDQESLLTPFLNTLFFSEHIALEDATKHFDKEIELMPGSQVNLLQLACSVVQRTLRNLPYTVRWWWNNQVSRQRDRVFVEKFIVKHLSSKLAAEELGSVKLREGIDDNVTIQCHSGCNELIAHYRIEETNVTLTVSLPLNHPLGPVTVKISDKKLHARISHLLNTRSHSLSAALKCWKENLDGLYRDVDECAICFFILHNITKQIPKLPCKTCGKKFHAACLYKWFSTSNKSECPLCRNLF